MNSLKCYPYIDNLYAIGIFLVLLGHSHSSNWSTFSGTILERVIVFIYTFHMPLFFFIAGFLFSNSQKIERIGFLKWGKEKTIKLLTPYVVLSVIAAVPKYYLEHRTFTGMGYYLIKAVLVPRLGVWGHFWFIPVLLFTYLIFGMLKQRIDITPIAMTITLVLSLLIYFLPFNTDWFGISDLKKGFVFFIIGMVVQKLEKRGGYYLV